MNEDTISRQAAIDIVNKNRDSVFRDSVHYEDAVYGISNLPAAQPKPQWIPCSERLPEKPGRYLATVEDLGSRAKVETALFDGDDFWENVRAWMPLPEPYKGDNDK